MSEYQTPFSKYEGDRHAQADAKEAYVREMFDAISPTYDFANKLMSFGLDKHWRRRLVREAALPQQGAVLDLCTGTGDILLEFKAARPDTQGTGLDFSEGMLAQARLKDIKQNLTWVAGSAIHLPFGAEAFDAVSMAYGLRSITDVPLCFREQARILKPGGRALCLELSRPQGLLQKAAYWPVLNIYLPLVGRLVSGHRDGYAYLRDTIKGFYKPGQVLEFMSQAGLKNVRALPLTLGAATLYVGEK